MTANNVFYAQSGGPTAVINSTACGVIEAARQHPDRIGKVFAGKNGILGALHEELIDTSLESDQNIAALRHTPGSAFGSCRFKLKSIDQDLSHYERLIDVFKAHDINTFFYNGGGDSQDTAYKVSQIGERLGYPLTCIGIPKTIDNDLALTDNCPGFGSTAKYIATSIFEASLDVASMAASSTKVFIMEVMGRHAGWIAAAAGLAQREPNRLPLIILFPEVPFDPETFLAKVRYHIEHSGSCSIAVSEGIKNKQGQFLSDSGIVDAFGHHQLGGVAPVISNLIQSELQYKCHWAVSDYLQRAASHIASKTDNEQAYAVGRKAVEFALAGHNNIMLTIERQQSAHYQWQIGHAPLESVANFEKKLPPEFISDDGFGITPACYNYLMPLTQGESFPPFREGLPDYRQLDNKLVEKRLATAHSTS